MRFGVLFSGGKDSTLALMKAVEKGQVVCLISLISKNPASYMFHTPNIGLTRLQAKAIGLPLIQCLTEGKKEEELEDLKDAIIEARKWFGIEGVVSGAIESIYQTERVQRICGNLGLLCFNPLWKKNQKELLEEILAKGFRVIVSGVFAFPLDRSWVGKEMNREMVDKLFCLAKQYRVSPSGEGGEIETTVLDAPLFRKRIEVLDSEVKEESGSAVFVIKRARLVEKRH